MKKTLIVLGIFIFSSSFSQPTKDIFKIIESFPFKYSELVKKQFLLESAHGKSEVFIKNHNGFGMRKARLRRTTALYSRSGYAVYRNIWSCVLDRYMYEQRYMSKLTRKQYLKYLNKVYSDGSGNYVKVLSKINIEKYNR